MRFKVGDVVRISKEAKSYQCSKTHRIIVRITNPNDLFCVVLDDCDEKWNPKFLKLVRRGK